jgi:hypothetical protein
MCIRDRDVVLQQEQATDREPVERCAANQKVHALHRSRCTGLGRNMAISRPPANARASLPRRR